MTLYLRLNILKKIVFQCRNFMFECSKLISYDHGVKLQAVPLFDLNLHDESITEKKKISINKPSNNY